jgi:hypothetical protein
MDEVQFFFDTTEIVLEFDRSDATYSPESVSFDGSHYMYSPAALMSDVNRVSGETSGTY